MTATKLQRVTVHPNARFWDWIAESYARKPVANEAAYQKKLRITREYLRPEMEVLEFGCGTGSTAIAHSPFVKHILATDISAKMVEIAEQKALSAGVRNVDFRKAGIDDLEAAGGSYDAVLGMSILHLLPDRDAAIAKVWRLLKPGGVFVSSTACLGDSMPAFKLIGPIGHFLRLLPLVQVFKLQALESSLVDAGFETEQMWQPGKRDSVFIVARKAA